MVTRWCRKSASLFSTERGGASVADKLLAKMRLIPCGHRGLKILKRMHRSPGVRARQS